MHHDDRPRSVGQDFFDGLRSDVVGMGIDIREDGDQILVKHADETADVGNGGSDHLITGFDQPRTDRGMKRCGSGTASGAVFHPEIVFDRLAELADLVAAPVNQTAVFETIPDLGQFSLAITFSGTERRGPDRSSTQKCQFIFHTAAFLCFCLKCLKPVQGRVAASPVC